jgi:hypothetical protein
MMIDGINQLPAQTYFHQKDISGIWKILEDPEIPEISRPVGIPDVACLPTQLVETVSQLILFRM